MSKNALEELRDHAVSQFFANFEAQGSPKDRAQYIAEETADNMAPIHYDYMAELLGLSYKGYANFLLHEGESVLDECVFQDTLFNAAQKVICKWLTNEMLDEYDQRQSIIEWDHSLLFETEAERDTAEQRVKKILGREAFLDSDTEDNPDNPDMYHFSFFTHDRLSDENIHKIQEALHPTNFLANMPQEQERKA